MEFGASNVTIAPHANGEYGRFSATDDERLEDLQTALKDTSADAILCARGGYGLQRIISRVNLALLNKAPLIIGFSDITALHQLYALHNSPYTIHGLHLVAH